MTDAELDALIDQSQCITYYTSSDEAERLIKKLAVALAALREQVAAKDADIAAIRELMNVYNLGGWTDAIAPMKRALAAEADNAALREQVEAFRREQIARSKIDPVTRLHNLCDHLADQRRESPFTAESLELADASYKELCADNAALRQWIDNNMTHYNTAEAGARPIVAEFGKRVWYHVTDDCESIPFSRVIDDAMRAGGSHDRPPSRPN